MRRIDAVNWLRLSFLLALAQFKCVHCIQVVSNTKAANSTQFLQKEETAPATDNATQVGDSELSASERNRRLIPYMAFYLSPDFPINQQYAIEGSKEPSPINGKYSKPIPAQPSLTSANGHIPIPQSYMNLRAPPPGSPSNGDLMFGPVPQQKHYLQNAGDVYKQLAYAAAVPATQTANSQTHSQPAPPPPISQSLINTKGSKVPVLQLFPPGPPGPPGQRTVTPIIKHRHKTIQHFPPTKPPTLQQLPYEHHLQPQLQEPPQRQKTNRHNAVAVHQQLLQQQQQQQPIFVQQHEPQPLSHQHQQQQQQQQQQHQQQVAQTPLYFRQQTRPKQSKVNLTPFTPSNTLPGHFIPIIYTPLSGNGNENGNKNQNNNNNNHDANALNYGYDNPTVVLFDDLSPPIQSVNLQQHQQQQQQQQQQHIQQKFRPSTLENLTVNNEYTLVDSAEVAPQQKQQQQQQELQQKQQQTYIAATGTPTDIRASQQADLPAGSSYSGASLNPQSATSPIYHNINEPSAPAHPITSISLPTKQTPKQQTQLQQQQQQQQQQQIYANEHSQSHRQHSTMRNYQKYSNYQSPNPTNFYESTAPAQELLEQPQQQQELLLHQDDSSYSYLHDETMTPQEKYVRYLQQRIRYNKQQQKQRDRIRERENSIKLQQLQEQQQHSEEPSNQQQQTTNLQQPQSSQIAVFNENNNLQPPSTPSPKIPHSEADAVAINQEQLDSNPKVNYPQHSPIRHAVYPYPELHIPPNHQPPATNVATVKQVVKIPIRTLVSEALDAFQQQQQQQQQQLTAKGANGVGIGNEIGGLYRQQSQYVNGLGVPATQYIDYIVDDPKQSLEDEQHHHLPTAPPAPPVIPTDDINEDYYASTRRPHYKQQPTLRLKPLSFSSKYNNQLNKRPIAAELQPSQLPHPQPQQPPLPTVVDQPKYIYADSHFGEKMTTPAVKLRPSHQYSSTISNKLTPPPPPPPPRHPQSQQKVTLPAATSHQFKERPLTNLPQYYNPPVPVAAKTTAIAADPNQLPDIRSSSLAEILHKLQASNHLPTTLTPENIDNSIKTLVTILENLKQTQTIVANPPQHHDKPAASPDYDYTTDSEEVNDAAPNLTSVLPPIGPNKHPGPSTGRAGIDYPNYADIPQTNFNCAQQRYKGFFGDPETNCQVWHYCDLNGGKASFLCPNGTIFSQIALTCDWWFNVKCSTTAQLYVLNERLYKYILPFTPKFPEDYSGPLVDKYLAMKFQEMEEKMRIEKEKAAKAANEGTVAPTSDIPENNNNKIVTSNDGGAVDVENDNNNNNDALTAVTTIDDTEMTTVADTRTVTTRTLSGGGHNKQGAINAHVSEQSSERNLLIDDEVDDISKRGGVDTFESSTISTASQVLVADKESIMKPIVASSATQVSAYDDDDQYIRNADEEMSRTLTTENAQHSYTQATTSTQSQETQLLQKHNQEEEIQASPKPVRQAATTTNIDVEKVEVIEIKAEGENGRMGTKMFYGAESAKDA